MADEPIRKRVGRKQDYRHPVERLWALRESLKALGCLPKSGPPVVKPRKVVGRGVS